jgi:hypothetical protein
MRMAGLRQTQDALFKARQRSIAGLSRKLIPISPVGVFGTLAWHFVAMRRAA